MQTINTKWMDSVLAETACQCLGALPAGTTAPVAPDSSRVETAKYAEVERSSAGMQDFVMMRVKTYTKYHVTAMLDHQIILATFCTPSNVADTTVLSDMPDTIRRTGWACPGTSSMPTTGTTRTGTAPRLARRGWFPT